MPPELLILVFSHFTYTDWYYDELPSDGIFCHLPFKDTWFLVKCTRVCRYWQEVILNAPVLWPNVVLHSNVPRHISTAALLKLSGDVPLHLWANDLHDADIEALHRESPRLQYLHYHCSHLNNTNLSASKLVDTPRLRTLIIEVDVNERRRVVLPIVDPQSALPLLQHLKMSDNHFANCTRFFRPTMTSLVLQSTRAVDDSNPSVRDFLRALQDMPLLEVLRIHSILHPTKDTNAQTPRVRLSHLRSITVHEAALAMTRFLSYLELPASAFLAKDWVLPLRRILRNPRAHAAHACAMLFAAFVDKLAGKGLTGNLPVTKVLKIVVERYDPSSYQRRSICLQAGDGADPEPYFAVGEFPGVIPVTAFDILLSSPHTDFLARIEELVIISDKSSIGDPQTPESLLTHAQQLVGLKSLDLAWTAGIWRWLVNLHRAESGQSPSPLPFPQLRTLTLRGVHFRGVENEAEQEDFIVLLVAMLKVRRAAGLPALDSLCIHQGAAFDLRKDVRLLKPYARVIELGSEMTPTTNLAALSRDVAKLNISASPSPSPDPDSE